jgi:hypothetical protein
VAQAAGSRPRRLLRRPPAVPVAARLRAPRAGLPVRPPGPRQTTGRRLLRPRAGNRRRPVRNRRRPVRNRRRPVRNRRRPASGRRPHHLERRAPHRRRPAWGRPHHRPAGRLHRPHRLGWGRRLRRLRLPRAWGRRHHHPAGGRRHRLPGRPLDTPRPLTHRAPRRRTHRPLRRPPTDSPRPTGLPLVTPSPTGRPTARRRSHSSSAFSASPAACRYSVPSPSSSATAHSTGSAPAAGPSAEKGWRMRAGSLELSAASSSCSGSSS